MFLKSYYGIRIAFPVLSCNVHKINDETASALCLNLLSKSSIYSDHLNRLRL